VTGQELSAALDRAEVNHTELAHRLGITDRYVRKLLAMDEIPAKWAARAIAAIATRPAIRLSKKERAEVAELLDAIADETLEWSGKQLAAAKRYSRKLKASVGGYSMAS
jgi:hypothetical protein